MEVLLSGATPFTHQTSTICDCSPSRHTVSWHWGWCSRLGGNLPMTGSVWWVPECMHYLVGSPDHIRRALLALRSSVNSVQVSYRTIYADFTAKKYGSLAKGSLLTSRDSLITKCHPFHLVSNWHSQRWGKTCLTPTTVDIYFSQNLYPEEPALCNIIVWKIQWKCYIQNSMKMLHPEVDIWLPKMWLSNATSRSGYIPKNHISEASRKVFSSVTYQT